MKISCDRILDRIFITLFYAYACVSTCGITFGTKLVSYFMWPSILFGAILVLYRIIKFKKYTNMPGQIAVIGMIASIFLSTFANYQYNLKENLVYCIYWVLYFVVLYFVQRDRTIEEIKKDFEYIGILVLITINISVFIGLKQMFDGYAMLCEHPESGFLYWQGFAIGRLWGIYINPNRGAITVTQAVAVLLYFLAQKKIIVLKILSVMDMLCLIFYIALTDSRSGAVCIGVLFGVYVFFRMILWACSQEGERLKRICITVVISVLVVLIGMKAPREAKNAYNDVLNWMAEKKLESIEDIDVEDKSEEEINQEINEAINEANSIQQLEVERGYDLTGDISNNRFTIWRSGIEIFRHSTKNMIIGTSFCGFTPYAAKNIPWSVIITKFGFHYTTLENDILHVLVSQGFIGFAIMVWFVLSLFIEVGKKIIKVERKHRNMVAAMLALLFAYVASAFFGSAMFYQFSTNTVVFWAVLGYLMYILRNSGEVYED